MTDEQRDSLADQAAAWVPPWARPRPEPAEPPAQADAPPEADEPAGDEGDLAPSADARPDEPVDVAVPDDPVLDDPVLDEPVADGTAMERAAADESALHESVVDEAQLDEAQLDEAQLDEAQLDEAQLDEAQLDEAAPGGVAGDGEPDGFADGREPTDAAAPNVPGRDGDVRDPVGEGEAPSPAGVERAASADRPPRPVPAVREPIDDAELRAALEAILLVVDEPVAELVLAQVLEQPAERVAAMLERISADYTAAGHGFDLRRAAGGWRLYTRPEYATYVERFILDGQSVRLTQAALETLAVVAYKQPVTRSRISAIRGVNSDGTIRTLVSRGLVEECGAEPDSGAFLYRTTTTFLEKLGLNTVDELPPLAPFLPDDLEEFADVPR